MTELKILKQLFSQSWPNEIELVKYALARHGFGGDNGYYGVTYPSDLDEYEREVEGRIIPDHHVEINYWDGQHREITCKEQDYLAALEAYLRSNGHIQLAEKLTNA